MVTRLNQTDFIKTALRLPPELHAKLHQSAEDSGRSYNAEIVARLQGSYQGQGAVEKERMESADGRQFVAHVMSSLILGLMRFIPKAKQDDVYVAATRDFAQGVHAQDKGKSDAAFQTLFDLARKDKLNP